MPTTVDFFHSASITLQSNLT
jgi:hypothetical protein